MFVIFVFKVKVVSMNKTYFLSAILLGSLACTSAQANLAELIEYDPNVRTKAPKVMEADTGIVGYVNDKVGVLEKRTQENGDRLDRLDNEMSKLKKLEARVAELEEKLAAFNATKEAENAPTSTMSEVEKAAAEAEYNEAFDQLMASNYTNAAKRFKQFIEEYPESDLIGNAHYWHGETQFVSRKYEAALTSYIASEKAGGAKEGDALLKQAECYLELKKLKDAKAVLQDAKTRFADTDIATKATKMLSTIK